MVHVFVDLILSCHLQSLDNEPFAPYSRGEQFLHFVLEKHEHLMHILDSSVGLKPVKAAYALIVL